MPVLFRIVSVVTALLAPVWGVASEAPVEVDANLVTALDTSSSVGRLEEAVEREGLARALVHPQLLELIRAGPQGRIGFAVLMWSSHGHTKTLVPWTTIANAEDAKRVSQDLLSMDLIEESQGLDRTVPTDRYEAPSGQHQTDIALAIRTASAFLDEAPSKSRRSVINVVGRGSSNSGMPPAAARDAALNAGQIVNGLVVGHSLADDVDYYRTHVIGGPGAFVMQVSDPQAMTKAFLAKLRLDIAGRREATASDEPFLTAYTTDDLDP